MDDQTNVMKASSKNLKVAITMLDGDSGMPLTLHGLMEISENNLPLIKSMASSSHQAEALKDRLQRIYEWERANLPQWTPRISHQLFRLFGDRKPNNHAFTVKEIVYATGFSERAIRKQLACFEAQGWIIRGQNVHDRRNSHIKPSNELKIAYEQWLSLHLEI